MTVIQVKVLTCGYCGKSSPPGTLVQDVIDKAKAEGWLIGYHGATHGGKISGWEDDACAECAVKYPRIYCQGIRLSGVACTSKALYRITRQDDELTSCGHHMPTLLKELILGARKEEGVRVFVV